MVKCLLNRVPSKSYYVGRYFKVLYYYHVYVINILNGQRKKTISSIVKMMHLKFKMSSVGDDYKIISYYKGWFIIIIFSSCIRDGFDNL